MNFTNMIKPLTKVVSDNAATILTTGGVLGTISTAVLSVRAGARAQEDIRVLETYITEGEGGDAPTKKEKVQLTWQHFVAPAATGALTVGCIVFAHRISATRAAGLAMAYAASEKTLGEYKAKLEEKLTPAKHQAAKDEMMQKRVDDHPVDKSVVIIGHGDVLCYDAFSDRYFKGSAESIMRAERTVKNIILRENDCELGRFYKELGLPRAPMDSIVGFNLDHDIDVNIGVMKSTDDEPCLCVEFVQFPVPEWEIYKDEVHEGG